MDRVPSGTVTGRTVTACGKVLQIRAVGGYQGTVCIMTGGTSVMGLGISSIGQRRRITVTGSTVGRCYLHQARMIWGNRGMRCGPTICMTGLAVTARCKGFANC